MNQKINRIDAPVRLARKSAANKEKRLNKLFKLIKCFFGYHDWIMPGDCDYKWQGLLYLECRKHGRIKVCDIYNYKPNLGKYK